MSEQVHVRLTRKKKDKGLGADRLKKEASKKTPRHFQRQDRSHSHRARPRHLRRPETEVRSGGAVEVISVSGTYIPVASLESSQFQARLRETQRNEFRPKKMMEIGQSLCHDPEWRGASI